jgi:hypothetical protein
MTCLAQSTGTLSSISMYLKSIAQGQMFVISLSVILQFLPETDVVPIDGLNGVTANHCFKINVVFRCSLRHCCIDVGAGSGMPFGVDASSNFTHYGGLSMVEAHR